MMESFILFEQFTTATHEMISSFTLNFTGQAFDVVGNVFSFGFDCIARLVLELP